MERPWALCLLISRQRRHFRPLQAQERSGRGLFSPRHHLRHHCISSPPHSASSSSVLFLLQPSSRCSLGVDPGMLCPACSTRSLVCKLALPAVAARSRGRAGPPPAPTLQWPEAAQPGWRPSRGSALNSDLTVLLAEVIGEPHVVPRELSSFICLPFPWGIREASPDRCPAGTEETALVHPAVPSGSLCFIRASIQDRVDLKPVLNGGPSDPRTSRIN